ncbi:MAG: hypothetical protein ABII79_08070 [bacterium]
MKRKSKNPEDYDSYKKTQEFARQFTPKKNINYKWAYEYALKTLMNAREATLNLEHKAERMIHFLAPGTGIVTGILTLWSSSNVGFQWIVLIPAIVAIGCLIAAVTFAFRVLFPSEWTLGPLVKNAVLVAEQYPDTETMAMGYQSTVLAASVTWMCILMDLKGQQVKYSYRALLTGMLFAIISVIISYFFFSLWGPASLV